MLAYVPYVMEPKWALPVLVVVTAFLRCLTFVHSLPQRSLDRARLAAFSASASIPESFFDSWDAFHLEQVGRVNALTQVALPEEHQFQIGELMPGNSFTYRCRAYSSEKIRFARTVTFVGNGFNVFNLLIIPRHEFRLPLFGVDIVYLPKHHVVAIDFQPQSDSPEYCRMEAYTDHVDVLAKWRSEYSHSTLPPAVSRYFSPYAVWHRAPHSNFDEMQRYGDCFRDYLVCYCEALSKAKYSPSVDVERQFQREYLEYRIREDPAKNILDRCFGEKWTHEALTKYFFPVLEDQQ